jgi:acetate kinase
MRQSAHPILCINSGSSSVKFALYQCHETEETLVVQGTVKGIGSPDGRLRMAGATGDALVGFRGLMRRSDLRPSTQL